MTFARVNPAGWVDDEVLTHTQMNGLDADHADAIDGASGGSYSPVTYIDFPGAFGPRWGASRYPLLVGRTEQRTQAMLKLGDASGTWAYSYSDNGWTQPGTSASSIYIALDNIIDGGTITSLRVWVKGNTGHGGLPGTMPVASVYMVVTDGTRTLLGSQVDTAATVGAYEAVHYIDVATTSTNISQANGARYFIDFTGESGANAVAGLAITHARLDLTVSQVRP